MSQTAAPPLQGSGFENEGLMLRIWSVGFGVYGMEFGVWGSEFVFRSLRVRIYGVGFEVCSL